MPFLGKKPTEVASPVDINSGSIDGTTIGGGSAAPATVTTFTSSGIDDNATSTAITIEADGDVGLGNTSPICPLDVTARTGAFAMAMRARSNNDYAFFGMRSYDGTEDLGDIAILRTAADTGRMLFYTNNGGSATVKMSVLPSGGITFNGDTATANALDDYEEGTWTATLTNRSGSAPTFSLANSTGYYVKVGDLVHATWYSAAMSISAIGGTSSQISGLPYTIENLNNHYPVATFAHATCFSTQIQNGFGFFNTTNFSPNVEGGTPNPNWVTGSGLYLACSIVYRAA